MAVVLLRELLWQTHRYVNEVCSDLEAFNRWGQTDKISSFMLKNVGYLLEVSTGNELHQHHLL